MKNEFTILKSNSNYEINRKGQVRNVKTKRIIKAHLNKITGYIQINLRKNKETKMNYMHRLLAEAFMGLDSTGYERVVDHIDGNKSNNNLDNLRIITQRENTSKKHLKENRTSKYTNITFCKRNNRFVAVLFIKNKNKFICSDKNEDKCNEKLLKYKKMNNIV